jgi:2-polyprenyl-3-methyl-5-hydroxy-6-metoxy-1,4-benzoquinol methylase
VTSETVIHTQEISNCLLCGRRGQTLYEGLRDRLFGASGEWGHLQCPNCGLVWLNPRPTPSELHKVYASYYTHADGGRKMQVPMLRERVKRELHATVSGYERLSAGWTWTLAGRLLALVPFVRERVALYAMLLGASDERRLLDVGCGSGDFLSLMRDAGWDVTGVEPDVSAAEFARERCAIPVVGSVLEDAGFPDQSFDVIVLNHVIEHVFDPVGLLKECARVAKPSGTIIVVTPNVASSGYRKFGKSWIHLDPPRHLHLFSSSTIRACCEGAGLAIRGLRTSARTAAWVCTDSSTIARRGTVERGAQTGIGARLAGLAFQYREENLRKGARDVGEELVLVASRPTT